MSQFHTLNFANLQGWGPSKNIDSVKKHILDTYLTGTLVADLGCAAGKYSSYINSNNFSVIGIDHDLKFLKLAQHKNPKVTFVTGEALDLPIKDKSIDTVVAFDLLEHLPEDDFFKEMIRITTKRIIISVPKTTDDNLSTHFILFGHHSDSTHLRTYTQTSLNQLAKSYGLKHIKIIPTHPISSLSIFMELFTGPTIIKKIFRKMILLFLRPQTFNTNLVLIGDF